MRDVLLEATARLAMQVDPNQGTLQAMQGAQQRIQEPHFYDIVFPVIAFLLVIVVPTLVAVWVLYKTVTEKTVEEGES